MVDRLRPRSQFLLALGIATLVSIGLYLYGVGYEHTLAYSYLLFNLCLSWIPLLLTFWLLKLLRTELWSSWLALLASFLWLLFLPNSFYMVSDFIHLQDVPVGYVLYDAVMFSAFIVTSLVLGFASVYLVHRQLIKRFATQTAALWIGLILLLCSFAIYLGRDLRWNSWDVLTNPAGFIFDLSDRLVHPSNYGQIVLTVLSFFVLLAGLYNLLWQTAKLLRHHPEI